MLLGPTSNALLVGIWLTRSGPPFMSEDPPTANVKPSDEPSGPEEDELSGPKEIVLSPPPGPPIIEDTASPPGTDNYAPRRLSKNSLSKFISPSHQMACGFQA